MALVIWISVAFFVGSVSVFFFILRKKNKALRTRFRESTLLYEFLQQVNRVLEVEEFCDVVEAFIGDRLGFRDFSFEIGDAKSSKNDPNHLEGNSYVIPLLFKMKVVGTLILSRPRGNFSEDEKRFLKTLAGELAIAIENIRLHSKNRELAVRDDLTGLHNRRRLQEILPLEIKRAQRFNEPLSLLMMDLDHFKNYNDRFGHLAGDERLREFARLISSRIREVDFFVRFGGEEFLMVLPNTSKPDAVKVAEKVRALLANHRFTVPEIAEYKKGTKPWQLTISIGVSSYPEDGGSMEDLIDTADIALYEAKRKGRDQVVVYESQTLRKVVSLERP